MTIILFVVVVPLAAVGLALITPHLMRMSGNMEKAAFDLWDERAADEGEGDTTSSFGPSTAIPPRAEG